ncbi:MAG: hypothetical protein OXQ28_05525 [Acidobacteriota bacterium]|nr:hypothetical protein [Acidobacteriota bacterium]
MSIEQKRRIWAAEQARMIFPVDDEIAKLADEIYEDMKATRAARVRGERQAGALIGLGFKNWIGPWGGATLPDTPRARRRIADSLAQKPYYSRLMGFGLVGHPQRRVAVRGEYLKPYCLVGAPEDGSGAVMWGLSPTRDRDEIFRARYDFIVLRVWDNGEVVAERKSQSLETGHSLSELGLDDDDYRFTVTYESTSGARGGKRFDYAMVENEWHLLPDQGMDWDGEYGESGVTHSGTERVAQQSDEERRAAFFRAARIAHENATYGHLATRYDTATVESYLSGAIDRQDKRAADLWSIVKRIQDDRAAAAVLEAEEEMEEADGDPKAEAIAFIKSIRDNPPNRAVRGNPHHIRKWNRALATLGQDTGETPWTAAEIRVRAEKWPQSPWARVAEVLAAGE